MSGTIDHGNLIFKVDTLGLNSLDVRSASDPVIFDWTQLFSNGTGANQASQQFYDSRTLSASATENLDLAGSLTNAFGQTITFTKVKAIAVKASSGNTNDVQVQRASSNGVPIFMAASDGVQLTPGAFFVMAFPNANGVAVTGGTGDLLTITNSAGGSSVTYEIWILGVD
jgi:hypothetical protein